MVLFNIANALSALEDLLDHEREIILTGKIGSFQRIAQDKERLLTRLAKVDADPETLQRVRAKAERNQELLVAAARGLKAATRRMEAMTTKRDTNLRTYGRDGASANLVRNPSGMNHRA
jgi:flagellar biosynthesis/type III secretory pathway chaperone